MTVTGGDSAYEELIATVDALRLVDHHCHGVRTDDLDQAGVEALLTEASEALPAGESMFDSPLGAAVRAICAPLLDLEPHVSASAYVARRRELGGEETARRLVGAAGLDTLLVDTGIGAGEADLEPLAAWSGGAAKPIVRLERLAEQVAATDVGASEFLTAIDTTLDSRFTGSAAAVGVKSIAAYRIGLDFEPTKPTRREVLLATGEWLSGPDRRLAHPVLIRHLIWTAVERGLPIQFHTGFGDTDLDLHRGDPSLLTGFIRATRGAGTSLLLLHCYPYHRQAGYLAQAYPHVYFDIGLAISHLGAGSTALIVESLELAPWSKQLYSSDAYGLPELYACGAVLWRRGMSTVLAERVRTGALSLGDATRWATMIARDNAARVYRLDEQG